MTAGQIRAARALIGMTQAELATKSEVSLPTIKRVETGADAKVSTMTAIRAALEAAGVVFLPENGNGPGVALRK